MKVFSGISLSEYASEGSASVSTIRWTVAACIGTMGASNQSAVLPSDIDIIQLQPGTPSRNLQLIQPQEGLGNFIRPSLAVGPAKDFGSVDVLGVSGEGLGADGEGINQARYHPLASAASTSSASAPAPISTNVLTITYTVQASLPSFPSSAAAFKACAENLYLAWELGRFGALLGEFGDSYGATYLAKSSPGVPHVLGAARGPNPQPTPAPTEHVFTIGGYSLTGGAFAGIVVAAFGASFLLVCLVWYLHRWWGYMCPPFCSTRTKEHEHEIPTCISSPTDIVHFAYDDMRGSESMVAQTMGVNDGVGGSDSDADENFDDDIDVEFADVYAES